QLHADRGGEMEDDVAALDQLFDHVAVAHGARGPVETGIAGDPREVVERSGGQVVDDEDFVTTGDAGIGEMRADETRSASYEDSHQSSREIAIEAEYSGDEALFRVRAFNVIAAAFGELTAQSLVAQKMGETC